MGIGKWILGGVCAVGAVVAAPVVLPMAAAGGAISAAGAAATGVASAAGAAATGVASAAAGAAATVGTAVASTSAGVAAVEGMAAIGSAVGAAAGTVGLSSVATVAGTTTGAAAVGTITTAGAIGAASTGYGAKKILEAKDIVDNAERKYNEKKVILDKEEKSSNESLSHLGELKLQIWSSFKEFYETIEKIKSCHIMDGDAKKELDNLKVLSFEAIELLSTSVGSIGAGALSGIAAYGGTMAIGTASTGTAIAGLSGAAATNATLAALGGGSLASGGLGMAGGTAVLGGLVAAPALAVGGIFIAFKGNSSIEKALEIQRQAEEAVEKLELSIKLVKDIKITSDKMYKELNILSNTYKEYLRNLKDIIVKKQDFRQFTPKEVSIVENTVLIVKVLKKITTTDLLITKDNKQEINIKGINEALNY